MDVIELYVRGQHHKFEGPSNWNEVPAELALKLVNLAEIAQTKPHAMMIILELLYGIPQKLQYWLLDEKYIRHVEPQIGQEDLDECLEQGLALINQAAWVYESDPPTNWLLKQIVSNGKTFYGPQDGLATSTFEEFMFAEQFYNDAIGKNYPGDLNGLVATLYRIGSESTYQKTGDYRFAFAPHGIDMRLKTLSSIQPNLKQLVLFNYRGVRIELAKTYQNVFKVSNTAVENTNSTWLDVACGLAGENISNFSAIFSQNVHVVLKYLDTRIAAMDKLKSKKPEMITDIASYYEAYFRDIATRLCDIGHSDETPRFWLNSDVNGLSEIETAVRTKLKLPCLVLDSLEYEIPVGDLNVRERVVGAFSILCTYKQGDTRSFLAAQNQARLIANKVLFYMIRDVTPWEGSLSNPDSLYKKGIRFYEDATGDITRSVNNVATGFFYEFRWEQALDLSYGIDDFSPSV